MNCREFAEVVVDLAREQIVVGATRTQALQHAEACASCAVRFTQEQSLLAGLQLVREALSQSAAPAYLEAQLLAALHAQVERKPSPLAALTRWWSWQWAAVAVAALLLVALLVGIKRRTSDEPSPQQTVAHASQPPSSPTPVAARKAEVVEGKLVAVAAPPLLRSVTRPRQPVRRVRTPQAPASFSPEDVTAPFYSLIEEGQMAPLESARIVRVEVPPASLVKWGVPLTETTFTQPLQADLLLGQDGLARAIRFVPNSQSARTQ